MGKVRRPHGAMVGGGGNMGEVHPRSAPPVGQSTYSDLVKSPPMPHPSPGGGGGGGGGVSLIGA